MNHAIDLVVFAILGLAGLLLGCISYIDGVLGAALDAAHVPPGAQIVLLVIVAVLLGVVAIRLFGRIFAALIIVLLLLILVRQAFPHVELPNGHLPPGFAIPTTGAKNI